MQDGKFPPLEVRGLPLNHPFWTDINFIPDWLYQRVVYNNAQHPMLLEIMKELQDGTLAGGAGGTQAKRPQDPQAEAGAPGAASQQVASTPPTQQPVVAPAGTVAPPAALQQPAATLQHLTPHVGFQPGGITQAGQMTGGQQQQQAAFGGPQQVVHQPSTVVPPGAIQQPIGATGMAPPSTGGLHMAGMGTWAVPGAVPQMGLQQQTAGGIQPRGAHVGVQQLGVGGMALAGQAPPQYQAQWAPQQQWQMPHK